MRYSVEQKAMQVISLMGEFDGEPDKLQKAIELKFREHGRDMRHALSELVEDDKPLSQLHSEIMNFDDSFRK